MAIDPRVRLVALVGAGVAMALGLSIPRDESGRTTAPAIEQTEVGPALRVKHVSGRQYLRAYLDIVGVPTACDGIIRYGGKPIKPGQVFTEEQCERQLAHELAVHAEEMLACTPGLRVHPFPSIERRREGPRFAAVSLTYNVGGPRWCSSTARRQFNAGNFSAGCEAITWWNRAGGRVVRGLVLRRAREALVCREGLGALERAYG